MVKRQVVTLFSLAVLGVGTARAQVNSYDGRKPEVAAGAKSLVFSYTPFQSNLDPIPVSAVGAANPTPLVGAGFRYFVGARLALGVGLNFGRTSVKDEASADELSATTIGAALELNYHLRSLYAISPYIGGHVDYGHVSAKFTPGGGGPATELSTNGFGAQVQLGFDWFFTEGLALGGRYFLGMRSFGAPEQNGTKIGQSGTQFAIGGASVLLNVHF